MKIEHFEVVKYLDQSHTIFHSEGTQHKKTYADW